MIRWFSLTYLFLAKYIMNCGMLSSEQDANLFGNTFEVLHVFKQYVFVVVWHGSQNSIFDMNSARKWSECFVFLPHAHFFAQMWHANEVGASKPICQPRGSLSLSLSITRDAAQVGKQWEFIAQWLQRSVTAQTQQILTLIDDSTIKSNSSAAFLWRSD